MTLTLVNEEVVVYMAMKQQIEDLQLALHSANEYITKLESLETITEYEFKEPPSTPKVTAETISIEFVDAKTAWTDEEKDVLRSRIFHTGTYYGHDRLFSTIRALFPNRTEDGVKGMIYVLGGTCKKGIVQPKIKGDK